MVKAPLRKDHLFYLLTAAIILGGGLFWISNLSADPPAYFSGVGQSLATDPAHCVYHARNQILFDNPDPFEFSRWIVIRRSVTAMTAYLWFSIAGVSLKQAAMAGVLLTLAALILFLCAVSHRHRPWVTAAVAVCYLVNICLIVHGRLSFLENGLVFITSLLFYVYSRWGDNQWGIYLSAVLVAAAALMGKLFGILLLPAFLLAVWISGNSDRVKKVAAGGVAFIVGLTVLFVALFSTGLPDAVRFYTEGAFSLHGFPAGLTSPWSFVEHFISYGSANSLIRYSPDLLVFLWLGGFLFTYFMVTGDRLGRMPRVTILAALTIPCVLIGLSPVNYSPLRYGLLLIPPAIILFFTLLDNLSVTNEAGSRKTGYIQFLVLLVVTWQVLFHVTGMAIALKSVSVRAVIWGLLPVAVAITWTIRHFISIRQFRLGQRSLYLLLATVLTFTVSINGYRILTHLSSNDETCIERANADLRNILGGDAVVAGPYAPALTLDTDLKSFIYYFGVAEAEPDLLQRFPITHLAIDSTNWIEAVKAYPVLRNEVPIATYNIRDYEVRIYGIAEISGNIQAGQYRETAYERAATHRNRQEYHEAYAEISAFVRTHPTCWSGNILLAELLMRAQQFDQAAGVLTALANRHPNDYYTNLICGRSFQVMGLRADDSKFLALAQKYYEKAAQDDPYKAENVRLVYETTMRQLNSGSN